MFKAYLFNNLAQTETGLQFHGNHKALGKDSISYVQSSLKSHPLRMTLYVVFFFSIGPRCKG